MGFADVKAWLNTQTTNLTDGIQRFKNQNFLDGIVAGCALVAAADGSIDASEKQKMLGFIQRNEDLKVFEMSDIIKSFNKFAGNFEFDHEIGKAEALQAVGKLKSNEEAATLLVRVCSAIGMSDGDFDESEKAMVREICVTLGLKPANFNL